MISSLPVAYFTRRMHGISFLWSGSRSINMIPTAYSKDRIERLDTIEVSDYQI